MNVLTLNSPNNFEQSLLTQDNLLLDYVWEDNPVKNWLRYRLRGGYDCDASPLALAAYAKLWPNLEYRRAIKDPADKVQGDTMCSFWTTYKQAIKLWGKETSEGARTLQKYGLTGNWGAGRTDLLLENFTDFKEINEEAAIREFAYRTHTIGNMIVVPNGMNVARARIGNDYWDITLEKFYANPDGTADPELITAFQYMLNNNNMYLDDWLNGKEVKMLPGHTVETALPQTLEDLFKLVEEINRRIASRTHTIAEVLAKK